MSCQTARTPQVLRVFIASALVCGLGVSPAWALFSRGGGLGEGARAMGMGGAYAAVSDDPSAAYWNPAGAVQMRDIEVLGMFGSLFNDKDRNGYLSFHYPTKDEIHLGFSYNLQYYSELKGAHEDTYTASLAVPLSPDRRWMIGTSFRYLYGDLKVPGGIVRGGGFDLGAMYLVPLPANRQLRAAFTVTDLFTTVRFNNGVEQDVPRIYTPGVAFRYDPDTLASMDLGWTDTQPLTDEGKFRFRTGLERWFFNHRWAARIGYESFTTLAGDLTLGASYETRRWGVDYAYMGHAKGLGNSHRISLLYRFDAPGLAPIETVRPLNLQALVGDGTIYLHWNLPPKTNVDGYWVYFRTDGEKEYHQRRPEFLETDYCVLRGAENGTAYHIYLQLIVNGKQGLPSNEIVSVPRPVLPEALESYRLGVEDLEAHKVEEGFSAARRAEEMDPQNYDIKELIRRLQKAKSEGFLQEK